MYSREAVAALNRLVMRLAEFLLIKINKLRRVVKVEKKGR